MGRGLYATQDINKGELIFVAELLVLSETDTKLVNLTDLQYYTFKYNEKQDCLVLGDGEIFNHADQPNVGYQLVKHASEDRQIMLFHAIQDVKQGDQLMIDYAADTKVDASKYNVNLI